jgi:uncharacterized protein
MNIWIDLANSPQVLFFRPLICELERRRHTVVLTTRDYAQTIPLATQYGMTHTTLGSHGGTSWLSIVTQNLKRVTELVSWVRTQPRVDLAVSHNSYSQAIAAARLGMPFVTLMDYEHQPANHLCFRLARRVIVPECFPEARLQQFGAARKVRKYAGIKEQIYLADFEPTPNYLESLGVSTDKPVVVMRPPAPWAAYHRKFRDTLFDDVLETVTAQDVTVIFTPRVSAQAEQIRGRNFKNVWIPQVLDGPNLMYHADAVISGGGTMNREAGVLGTPAYTVFQGKLAAADEWLVERGRLRQVTRAEEMGAIGFKERKAGLCGDGTLVRAVTNLILE